jgi:hypothetical protein
VGPLSGRDTTPQTAAVATHCIPLNTKLRPFRVRPLMRNSRTFRYFWPLRGLRLYMDQAFVLPQLKPVGFAIRTHAPSHPYGFGVVFTS